MKKFIVDVFKTVSVEREGSVVVYANSKAEARVIAEDMSEGDIEDALTHTFEHPEYGVGNIAEDHSYVDETGAAGDTDGED